MSQSVKQGWKNFIAIVKRLEVIFLGIQILFFGAFFLYSLFDRTPLYPMRFSDKYFFTFIGGMEFLFYGLILLSYKFQVKRVSRSRSLYLKIARFSKIYVMYFSFLNAMIVGNIILAGLLGDKRFLLFYIVFFVIYYLYRPGEDRIMRELALSEEERKELGR